MRSPTDLPPSRRRLAGGTPNRGRIILLVVVAVLVFLLLSARGVASFATDYLWFRQLHASEVFTSVLWSKILLVLVFGVFAAAVLVVNLRWADGVAPLDHLGTPEEQVVERYRTFIEANGWKVRVGVGLAFGLITGLPMASSWNEFLLWRNATSFGQKDDLFHKDLGFYIFKLPFISTVIDWAFTTLVIVTLFSAAAHYLNGSVRTQGASRRSTSQVKLHLSVLLALLALLKAVGYWFQRYRLTTSTRSTVLTGANYTDVKAQLPAISLLALISLLAAVLLLVNVRQKGWRLPVIAVGLWGLVAVVAGGLYPVIVQRFVVRPNESGKEAPYLQRNINATRAAYGLDKVVIDKAPATSPTTAGSTGAATDLSNVRLLDPLTNEDNVKNDKAGKGYYTFNAPDVDRYKINDAVRQVLIGVRELNPKGVPTSFVNKHLAYTHGWGVAVSPASDLQANGRLQYLDGTPAGPPLTEPRVYFAEGLSSYAVANTKQKEIDGDEGSSNYAGSGGVQLNSGVRRLAYALRFGDLNLLLSSDISDTSRIMYIRDVSDRVAKLAPFLKLDADPYPVVSDGHVKWIVDGYTTTDRYPYAQRANLSSGDRLPDASGLNTSFNYVRNSVKAVVDAYDGSVTLYIVDATDPIIRAWQGAFPHLMVSIDTMPTDLRDHLRYPQDMFREQSSEWGRYRVQDPGLFYQRDLAWKVSQAAPREPAQRTDTAVAAPTVAGGVVTIPEDSPRAAPYYTLLKDPPTGNEQFVLMRTYAPFSLKDDRRDLAGYMTASSDPLNYGTLHVREISSTPLPDGPYLVDKSVSQAYPEEFTAQNQQGSRINFGDLQLVPVGDAIAWVRPWFIRGEGTTAVPELQYVTITIGRTVTRGRTLAEAVQNAFGITIPGADAGTPVTPPAGGTPTPGGSPGTGSGAGSGSGSGSGGTPGSGTTATAADKLAASQAAYQAALAALADGKPEVYITKLREAYQLADEAARLATGTPTTTAAPTPITTAPSSATTVSGSPPTTQAPAGPTSTFKT